MGEELTAGGRKRTGGFWNLTGQKQTFAVRRPNRRVRPNVLKKSAAGTEGLLWRKSASCEALRV
jgi:hypothetical protein